jgi:peptidoglycan hydrolase FlgJ
MSSLLPAPVEIKPLASLGSTLERARRDATRNAAEDFESVFIAQMLEPMFEGLKTDGMFGGGSSEGIFRSLMVQEVGKEISRAGGVGITDAIYDQMLKMQGLAGTPAKESGTLPAPAAANLSDAVLGQMLKMQAAGRLGEALP